MLGKINRLKRKMKLHLSDDIFDMDVVTIYNYYGIVGARYYSWFRLACFLNDYFINKYVFDEFNNFEINEIMRMLHNVYYIESKKSKYNKIKGDLCKEYGKCVDDRYTYYLTLITKYKYILTKIKDCKTLPNKYTTKERRN